MRVKDLFIIQEGKKVTEKALGKVLVSSVCSILLCMACLSGTTWAWFTVSTENTENVIRISKPEVLVTVNGSAFVSGSEIEDTVTTHIVAIEHANGLDDLQKKSTLYVTLTIHCGEATNAAYITLKQENGYRTDLNIEAKHPCSLSWEVSWFAPAGAIELIGDTIYVAGEDPTESTTEPTEEAEEPSTAPSAPTEGTTSPGETTAEPTEDADVPTETAAPSTEETEGPIETNAPSTEETNGSTETTIPLTEGTDDPTEDTSETLESADDPTESTADAEPPTEALSEAAYE